jgi:hypothetical protein
VILKPSTTLPLLRPLRRRRTNNLGILRLGVFNLWVLAIEDDFGLFEVATGVFVNEDETEVVAGGVFLVDFAEGGG